MFALAISCLTIQFGLIHRPNIPGSYAILIFTASDFTSIISHIHSWALFPLWLRLSIPSGAICPLLSCSIMGHLLTFEVHQCHVFLSEDMCHQKFSVIPFCLFILFMAFSRQECWCGLPFPSPVDHILSELSTMTCPSWVALHGMTHIFIELDKPVVHVIRLVSFLWLWFSVYPMMENAKECSNYHTIALISHASKVMLKILQARL